MEPCHERPRSAARRGVDVGDHRQLALYRQGSKAVRVTGQGRQGPLSQVVDNLV